VFLRELIQLFLADAGQDVALLIYEVVIQIKRGDSRQEGELLCRSLVTTGIALTDRAPGEF